MRLGAENAMKVLVRSIMDKKKDQAEEAYELIMAWLDCQDPTVHPNWKPEDLAYVLNLFGMDFIYCAHNIWEKEETI